MVRRDFLKAGLAGLGALWMRDVGLGPTRARASSRIPAGLESWPGEALQYRVRCPLLSDFAAGELRFQGVHGSLHYFAVLETNLRGVIGLLTLQRSDLFASLMEWSPDDGRFLPIWHADQASRAGSWKRKVVVFQRDRGEYIEHRIYPERVRQRRWKTEGRILDDPLSAFYNWRIGAFGPLGFSRSYQIDNLARKDPFVLQFQTASEEESKRQSAMEPSPDHKVHLLRARLDQELQESVRGDVEAWLDEDWVPVEGRANRVRWVGEVTAYLTGRKRLSDPERATSPAPPLQRELWRI